MDVNLVDCMFFKWCICMLVRVLLYSVNIFNNNNYIDSANQYNYYY